MRTAWRILVRTVFWSFERGTWPYDVAVALIVLFVLFSPRSWFNDRPVVNMMPEPAAIPALVELRGADPVDGAPIYRVDARLVSKSDPDTEHQLHESVLKHAGRPPSNSDFKILRIAPVHGADGAIAYYDIFIKP